MAALQLHQVLAQAGTVESAGSARHYIEALCQRLGIHSNSKDLKQQFFALLTYTLARAPSLACSWVADYVAWSAALTSSDPEEAFVLQPQGVLAWSQREAAGLQQRVGTFLSVGPSRGGDQVLDLAHAAQALLSITRIVQAAVTADSRAEVQRLAGQLQHLQQATTVLQVLEQLQQQRSGHDPLSTTAGAPYTFPTDRMAAAAAGAAGSATPVAGTAASNSLGQQSLLAPNNADVPRWQLELQQRQQGSPQGRLFLDDLQQLLRAVHRHSMDADEDLAAQQVAGNYPYASVLGCVQELFLGSSGNSGGSGSSGSDGGWHARLAVLLYYLLDGGWLSNVESFAQGFHLPLTLARQWQCHYLLDAAAAAGSADGGSNGSIDAAATGAAVAALNQACQLLGATACPETPFRFVEALWASGRPATALAVQRARCAGGGASSSGGGSFDGSSSLREAQVLLRVQLGCGLLAEGFCDARRHCSQVPSPARSAHTMALVKQLVDWALTEPHTSSLNRHDAAGAAVQLQQTLHLQDQPAAVQAAAAAAGGSGSSGGGYGSSTSRQQQLCELPFNAAEEAALLALLRQRGAAGLLGGHLVPLYLLQRGRTLEAVCAYTAFKASPGAAAMAAAGTAGSNNSGSALLPQLEMLMHAAAAALPPALQEAVAGGSDVVQGLVGPGAAAHKSSLPAALKLQRRGVEPPAFMAPVVSAAVEGVDAHTGDEAAAMAADGGPAVGAGLQEGLVWGWASPAAAAVAGSSGSNGAGPLLFGPEVMAEAGPGTVRLHGAKSWARTPAPAAWQAGSAVNAGSAGGGADGGGWTAAGAAGLSNKDDGDVVPLLFGTPAPSAAQGSLRAAAAGIPDYGGLFGGAVSTSAAARRGDGDFAASGVSSHQQQAAGLMTEAEFEREVLGLASQPVFGSGTPLPAATPAAAVVGVMGGGSNERSTKRVRQTPL